jgi:hypothetical protein
LGVSTAAYAQLTPGTVFATDGTGTGFLGFGTSTTTGHQGFEYGDEVLSPVLSQFTGASISYSASAGAASGGSLVFRIYDMTGPALAGNPRSPGTLLYISPTIPLQAGNNTASISYTAGDFWLPQRFTYTVSFSGTSLANDAGLRIGGPNASHAVGISAADYWQRTGTGANDWALNQVTDNFGNMRVTISANVPEPTTVALGVVGAALLAGMALRRNRG